MKAIRPVSEIAGLPAFQPISVEGTSAVASAAAGGSMDAAKMLLPDAAAVHATRRLSPAIARFEIHGPVTGSAVGRASPAWRPPSPAITGSHQSAVVCRAANSTPRPSADTANSDDSRGSVLSGAIVAVSASTVHRAAPRKMPDGAETAKT